jgi:choline transport protein
LLQQISFGIPAALLLYRRWTNPGFLPESQPFRLPTRVGYFVNIVVVLWTLVALVFYDIPPTLPVTGTNMSTFSNLSRSAFRLELTARSNTDYSSAVLSIIGLFGAGNWYMHAKKQYRGPIQVDGVVIGLAIEG